MAIVAAESVLGTLFIEVVVVVVVGAAGDSLSVEEEDNDGDLEEAEVADARRRAFSLALLSRCLESEAA